MITGRIAFIKWAYYTAAQIEGYTVTRSKDGTWSLTATVVLSDAFKMAQTPLTFVATHAKGEWRWPIVSAVIDPAHPYSLTADLGPPLT